MVGGRATRHAALYRDSTHRAEGARAVWVSQKASLVVEREWNHMMSMRYSLVRNPEVFKDRSVRKQQRNRSEARKAGKKFHACPWPCYVLVQGGRVGKLTLARAKGGESYDDMMSSFGTW